MQVTFLKDIADDKRISLICVLTGYSSIFLCAASSRFGIESLEIFGVLFALCCIFASLIILLTCLYGCLRCASLTLSLKWGGRAAILYTLALLFFTNMLILGAPASSWDFLSYWSLEALTSMPNVEVIKPEELLFESQKHPWMMSSFLASSQGFIQNTMAPGYFWFSLLLLNVLCLKVLVASLRLDLIWLPIAFCIFFVPLVENHYTAFGYAEVALSLGFNLFFCLFHYATRTHSPTYFFFALLAAFSLMLIKTTGSILCIICLIAASGSFPKIYKTSHTRMLWFSCFSCMASVIAILSFSGWDVSLLKTGTTIISPKYSVVVDIFQRAFLENSSFSVTALLSICCFFYLVRALRFHPAATSILCLMLIFLGITTYLVLFVFTEYGLGHSLPGVDTSFSRLALPAAGTISILTLFGGHVLQSDQNYFRSS